VTFDAMATLAAENSVPGPVHHEPIALRRLNERENAGVSARTAQFRRNFSAVVRQAPDSRLWKNERRAAGTMPRCGYLHSVRAGRR